MAQSVSLSIIVPAYNEEDHLGTCLDAIAAQSEMPEEVIVVDNNSTDRTAEIAASYPFVRVITARQQGVVFARNAGFDAARTDIIGRIDADTHLSTDWVKRVKAFYADGAHALHGLTGGCYFYNVRFPHFAGWWQGQIAFRVNRLLMGHYILFGSNMAIPRKLWQETRELVCDDTDVHEDLDLAIHAHRLGYQITYDESLRVGIKMRRVYSNRDQLWDNLLWWPKTLKRHGKKTWPIGVFGAALLYCGWPLAVISEKAAVLFGKKPLN